LGEKMNGDQTVGRLVEKLGKVWRPLPKCCLRMLVGARTRRDFKRGVGGGSSNFLRKKGPNVAPK